VKGGQPASAANGASSDTLPIVAVYADESCLGNGREGENPGGAGGVIEYRAPRSGEVQRRDYWISEPATTNNRMALRSAIEAFRVLSGKGRRLRVYFTSDSRYLVDGMTAWTFDWVRRNWRRKAGPIENLELWQELLDVAGAHDHYWRWVRGHAGHAQNEYANMLATRAAATQTHSAGARPSEFEAWLAAERARGARVGDAEGAPVPQRFARGCTLRAHATGRLL
jgi:ribonuclease HI